MLAGEKRPPLRAMRARPDDQSEANCAPVQFFPSCSPSPWVIRTKNLGAFSPGFDEMKNSPPVGLAPRVNALGRGRKRRPPCSNNYEYSFFYLVILHTRFIGNLPLFLAKDLLLVDVDVELKIARFPRSENSPTVKVFPGPNASRARSRCRRSCSKKNIFPYSTSANFPDQNEHVRDISRRT